MSHAKNIKNRLTLLCDFSMSSNTLLIKDTVNFLKVAKNLYTVKKQIATYVRSTEICVFSHDV